LFGFGVGLADGMNERARASYWRIWLKQKRLAAPVAWKLYRVIQRRRSGHTSPKLKRE
jgi:hypothetical protein